MKTLLEVKNLSKRYAGKPVLDNVNFSIDEGKIVGLLGPNGSGKTTLIKIINTLITDYKGTVLVGGTRLGPGSKTQISYLPDINMLSPWMKIRTVLAMYDDLFPDFDRVKAEEMLRIVNLSPGQTVKSLSKGMHEKLQLVLVMSRSAKLYIFDEPIAGVDPASRDYIMKTILTNYSEDASILFSTHLISDIEVMLDRVLFLNDGKIILDEDVETIREEKGTSIDGLFREVFKC